MSEEGEETEESNPEEETPMELETKVKDYVHLYERVSSPTIRKFEQTSKKLWNIPAQVMDWTSEMNSTTGNMLVLTNHNIQRVC